MSREPARTPSPLVVLAVFVPMCAFAAAHWAGLVATPPADRVAAVVALAAGCAGVLAASAHIGSRVAGAAVRVAAVAVAAVCSAVAIGLPPEMLVPSGWGELLRGLSHGFQGVPQTDWPYAGGDRWVRTTILLAIPAMSIPAAAFAMWPPAPGPGGPEAAAVRRGGALLLLLTLFALAAAQRPVPDSIERGAALLVLIALWIFLPRVARARPAAAVAGAGAVVVAGLLAIPLAAAIAPERPLIDPRASAQQPPARETGDRAGEEARNRDRSERERRSARERADRSESAERRSERRERSRSSRERQRERAASGGGGAGAAPEQRRPRDDAAGPSILLLLALLAALAAAVRFLLWPRVRRRLNRPRTAADAVAELRTALERLGWTVPASTTLAALEPRLAQGAGPPAARYAARLREWRYTAHGAHAPTRLDRRELRRSLTEGGGPLGWFRGLWALPPAPLVPGGLYHPLNHRR